MEHLALEVFELAGTGSQYAALPEDASITITDTSEIFGSGDVWSHGFTLNVNANAHIIGTAGEIHGARLHEQLNRRKARLWVEGLPLYLGYLKLDDEVEVDGEGNIDVVFESGQKTFDEMVEGAKANQVPLMGDVPIGVALWRERLVQYQLKLTAEVYFDDEGSDRASTADVREELNPDVETVIVSNGNGTDAEQNPAQPYPRMVYPRGDVENYGDGTNYHFDFLNTDYPYTEDADGTPTHPFCNVALCYQKYGYDKKDEKTGAITQEYNAEPEAQRGYEYMPASRVNSAPNFYVIYWLRALFRHLGIRVEENQMMNVEDLRRLFFVNTNCAYKIPKHRLWGDTGIRWYMFGAYRLLPEHFDLQKNVDIQESHFDVDEGYTVSEPQYEQRYEPVSIPEIERIAVKIEKVDTGNEDIQKQVYVDNNSYLHDAFATSECFPDADVSAVIKAIENGFGVRLLFNGDYRSVRIVLLRNVFRNKAVQTLSCDILDEGTKKENCIRGFRMTYGNTDDTHFYYKGFADMLPHKKELWVDDSDKHDYSKWKLDEDYASLLHKISAFDTTCYVTPETGNAYGIKVDKDAKRYQELHPVLFEFAGFMDAEDGDCSGEENTIETITMGFTPAIMNDLNMDEERKGNYEQRFALFVDEKMRPRRPDLMEGNDYNDPTVFYSTDKMYEKFGAQGTDGKMVYDDGIVAPGEFAIKSDVFAAKSGLKATVTRMVRANIESHSGEINMIPVTWDITGIGIDGHLNEGYRLYLQDNYEPNDDGVAPIETHQWGLTLGIMRGSGSDAYVKYEYDPDDGEDNDTWEIMPGSSATAHPDTCDAFGNEWDYNGEIRVTKQTVVAKLNELFPDSDAPFNDATLGYITETLAFYVRDGEGNRRMVLVASAYSKAGQTVSGGSGDLRYFVGLTLDELLELSRTSRHMVVEVDSSEERGRTLVDLCGFAYGNAELPWAYKGARIDNGVGARYGRFSLKLRSEKPNRDYDPSKAPGSYNRRYLPITNENLRRRGLADQFYKEYSYWVRNARIWQGPVQMELAQLLAIDKTVRVTVGDVTGFIRKMQYTVSNRTGLGIVTMEIMYL